MTKMQRKELMSDRIRTALRAIQSNPGYDWGPSVISFGPFEEVPENPKADAAERLCIAVDEYVEGKIDEDEVKLCYKAWVGLYAR